MNKTQNLRRSLMIALAAALAAFLAAAAATFAWYIYNTRAHTTSVRMAAGASASLQISSSYDGPYASTAVLDSFVGTLNPVSTNRISGGFQKVEGFISGNAAQPRLVANLFNTAASTDYYMTSLYLRASGGDLDVYVSNMGFEDDDPDHPISTAIRVGLVIHQEGQNMPAIGEYVFSINEASNPSKEYNTATGYNGCVLDCEKTDGTTVPFQPYTVDAFCEYDRSTGIVTLKPDSINLCRLPMGQEPVQVDVYIWLEGCDEDCTNSLCGRTLKNLAIAFSGYKS